MQITYDFIDYADAVAERRLPSCVIKRGSSNEWLLRNKPVGVAGHETWAKARGGDGVRIQLFPYLTTSLEPAVAVAHAFSLGAEAIADLRTVCGGRIIRMHVVVGNPLEECLESGRPVRFKIWLGFAMEVE